MSNKNIIVPDIGDIDEVEVIEILVSVGDTVQAEDSLITVESDKASMEIPCSDSGVVKEIKIAIGDTVKEGSVVIVLDVAESAAEAPASVDTAGVEAAPAPAAAPAPTPAPVQAAPAAAATVSAGPKEIVVPDIGDVDEVEVIEILVSVGDTVQAEDSLITVETDKASMEIPCSDAGTVKEIKVNIGDTVAKGSVVVVLDVEAPAQAAAPAPAAAPTPAPAPAAPKAAAPAPAAPKTSPTANIDEVSFKRAYASPSIRRLARELGVDLGSVKGSGRKQRIVKSDLFDHVKAVMSAPASAAAPASGNALGVAPMPEIDFSKFGEVETQALNKINKLTGQFLHRNYLTAIHVTQFDEADITEMEVFRKQVAKDREREGIKITPLAFIIQAVAAALKAFPRFNSSLDASGENLILKKYINIGIAVNTPGGLVVPVINDADKKSLIELSNEIRVLAGKAKDKKLKPSDMQGACFTISSLGGVGGTSFTPIINLPEVAILGVSNSKVAPVWDGKEFQPRTMLPLSLSYDHRVIDGVAGAQFTTYLSSMLSDIRRLLV
ncbi:dihydrolipoyllysine-residue acetyltransferase [Leucothrix arctica]|uniref:Acetyltransferase component of pyruvate dehydrogenase complex n=1 Tax=Leucothrix arctica TaxID=1481894 RepID=A0A317CHW9_9GAMM|nr:dihydrolipoyllysine-residue acetyltransferase [Leucothrix arctica]PWQ95872.1 dihydrolipoyllysine-residue acetyltransferase [Leucothrix arctica]